MAPLFTGSRMGGFGKNPDVASTSASFVLGSLANNTNPFGDNSCVALYKLDNSTSNSVSGSYGLTATGAVGVPVFTSQGVATDGVTKYFFDATPRDTKFNISGTPTGYPFSVSAWIWVPSSIGWGSGMGPNMKELLNANIGGQRVSTGIVDWSGNGVNEWTIMYGGTSHWTFTPSSTPTNQWIHIVFSIVNSNDSGHRLYQDGGSALTASNRGGAHGGTAGWQLGGNNTSSTSNDENANYYIDQVRIFNKALSQSEANNLYLNDRSFYNITTAAR